MKTRRGGERKRGGEGHSGRGHIKMCFAKTCYKFLTLSLGNSEQALGITGIAAGWEVRFPLGRVILAAMQKIS